MNRYPLRRSISFLVLLFISSVFAGAQPRNPLNLDKDFHNPQYKENGVKRVKKIVKSLAGQYTSLYEYDPDGYLTSFANDSALARYAALGSLAGHSGKIHYTPGRDKAFVISGTDTLHWLSFDDKKNLVHHRSAQPATDSFFEVKYYYGESGDLKFITGKKDPSSDKWITIQSFSHNYREGKLRSRKTDTSNTMYLYDNEGRLAEEYDSVARKGWKKYEYDAKGRITGVYEMRPGNRNFTFCPFLTQNVYDSRERLIKKQYLISARNDKTGNCGYTLASAVDYKYTRSGLVKKETGKIAGSSYTVKYKYKKH